MKLLTSATFVLLLASTPVLSDEVRSDVAFGFYICNVDAEAITNAPQWTDQNHDPPLSMLEAIRAANAKLKTLPANDAPVDWTLHRVTLVRKNGTGWYYISTFRSKIRLDPPDGRGRLTTGSNPYGTPRDIKIPVLMDGSVPEIAIHRHTDTMLELLDDLKL
ncbi:hypothetical protein Q31b_50410 [Novipirellula aureliae]|uniref:Uncharacterized protein n=1 Tax=Novipirellula aureliae TaxID=2527966 RepID=A0A5C6DL25_9BACT|nr:hypothetical protein [Novipirellula aureliae]TWU35606.1 hypothetical protein Q31b_50410 [Novipirellula aureliae]